MDSQDKSSIARRSSTASNGIDEPFERESRDDRTINFTEKLHLVLSNIECRDVISWLPSGRSFCIVSREKFVHTILPRFFKSRANFNSFERRLKSWGFNKIDASGNVYIFSHESFKRTAHPSQKMEEGGPSFTVMKQLRLLLSDPKFEEFIWWLPSGESFCVMSKSATPILFKYFGETKFKSFVTMLKREGFKRSRTSQYFGETVYSHELFRRDRPDLCRRMCRGGNTNGQVDQILRAEATSASLIDTSPVSSALGSNNPYLLSLQGGMTPGMIAQSSSSNFHFPMINGTAPQFSASQEMAAARISQAGYPSLHSTFPLNFTDHSQITSDLQIQQLAQARLCHNESLLLHQNQLLQGGDYSSSLTQQQAVENMLSSYQNSSLLNQRNSAAASAHLQLLRQQANGSHGIDATKMAILEIDNELLRVQELKLMLKKRMTEMELETNKK